MRPAPFPQRHIHAPGVHKVERDGEREGQAVVEKIMLEGGGTLSLREDGPRVHTEARRQNDGQGLYKVWLRGGGKGRLLLGTLVPEGGELVLSRTLSRRTLEDAGCWPVAGGRAVMAYPFTEESAGEWYWEEEPWKLVSDPVLVQAAGAGGPCWCSGAGRRCGWPPPSAAAGSSRWSPSSASGRWARSGEGNM